MIPLPTPPKVIEKKGDTTFFEIRGLYPGYGVTIGNALRRVLLSSLDGAAITQVKIENAPHEYSTLPGVFEDLMLILLNLKKLRFKLETKEPQTITLNEEGEKEVKGKHFKLSSEVKLANPDQKIATITSQKGKIKIEAKVSPGTGYDPLGGQDQEKAEVGVIFLDAIYTPVKKVNFRVENMRVGKRTDFDLLLLEIKTDGTITPENALFAACQILERHYALFLEAGKEAEKEAGKEEISKKEGKGVKKAEGSEKTKKEAGKTKIKDLNISEGAKAALKDNGLKTVAGILQRKKQTLAEMEGIGEKRLQEIDQAIQALGLKLKS